MGPRPRQLLPLLYHLTIRSAGLRVVLLCNSSTITHTREGIMYPLEASDSFGLEGLPDRARLLAWLESWLRDEESRTCQLEKLDMFEATPYLPEVDA